MNLFLIPGTIGKLVAAALFAPAVLGHRLPDFLLRHFPPAGNVKGNCLHVVSVLADECNDQLAQSDIPRIIMSFFYDITKLPTSLAALATFFQSAHPNPKHPQMLFFADIGVFKILEHLTGQFSTTPAILKILFVYTAVIYLASSTWNLKNPKWLPFYITAALAVLLIKVAFGTIHPAGAQHIYFPPLFVWLYFGLSSVNLPSPVTGIVCQASS